MATEFTPTGLWEIAGKQKSVEFRELSAATNLVPAPPSFMFGTFNSGIAAHYFRNHHLWAMGVYRLHRFDVYGPYALCKDGDLFCCHDTNIHPKHIRDIIAELGAPDGARPQRFVTGKAALIAGPGHKVYGHWLSDFLPKLYLLHACGHDIGSLRFLLPADTPSFGQAWMDLVGIPAENVIRFDPSGEIVRVEELLIPTTCHNGVRACDLLNDAAKFLRSRVAERAGEPLQASLNRNIFVSRARASQSRSLRNRDRIEAIATSKGLELVYPENMTLLEQVYLFGQAGMIAGEYGSALHGSMFSSPGTIVCALRGSVEHPGFIQSGFGHALKQPTGYVFGETDAPAGGGRFTVAEDAFADCLEMLLHTDGFERG